MNGYARMTDDVDVLVQGSSANIKTMLASLAGYGEGFARELFVDDFPDEEGAVRIVEEPEVLGVALTFDCRTAHDAPLHDS